MLIRCLTRHSRLAIPSSTYTTRILISFGGSGKFKLLLTDRGLSLTLTQAETRLSSPTA